VEKIANNEGGVKPAGGEKSNGKRPIENEECSDLRPTESSRTVENLEVRSEPGSNNLSRHENNTPYPITSTADSHEVETRNEKHGIDSAFTGSNTTIAETEEVVVNAQIEDECCTSSRTVESLEVRSEPGSNNLSRHENNSRKSNMRKDDEVEKWNKEEKSSDQLGSNHQSKKKRKSCASTADEVDMWNKEETIGRDFTDSNIAERYGQKKIRRLVHSEDQHGSNHQFKNTSVSQLIAKAEEKNNNCMHLQNLLTSSRVVSRLLQVETKKQPSQVSRPLMMGTYISGLG
jgi:hypothetical protein